MNAVSTTLDQKFHNVHDLDFRPTVAAVLILHGRQVLLVQAAKDESRKTWIFPQGKIKEGETVRQALTRELKEELGWTHNFDLTRARVLGEQQSPIPKEREAHDKHMIYVGVPVTSMAPVVLNKENLKYTFVHDLNALWFVSGRVRPPKFDAMCAALEKACRERLLGWAAESFSSLHRVAA